MSEEEEVEDMNQNEKYIFTEQQQISTKTEIVEDDGDEPRVHFEVMECEGEQFRLVRKPSKPKISLAKPHANRNRRSSTIWNQFTIKDTLKCIAACNICGMRLSYKSTVSNLRNHLKRRHNSESISRAEITKFQARHRPISQKKSKTELGSLDGLILNVVGEEGDPLNTEDEEVVEEAVVYTINNSHTSEAEAHVHPTGKQTPGSAKAGKRKEYRYQPTSYKAVNRDDVMKKSRILDLQLECLEMKKYTMQMEALVLEQQLNLPRSVYTESLREVDVYTRGTQTDVGGDTKVFYVSDKAGDSQGAHLFQFRGTRFE